MLVFQHRQLPLGWIAFKTEEDGSNLKPKPIGWGRKTPISLSEIVHWMCGKFFHPGWTRAQFEQDLAHGGS